MMTITSAAALVDSLRSTGLLEPPQLNELARKSPPNADPRALARQLMNQGLLTPFQINQVMGGHGKELTLGSYVLLERIGEGGMGQVFKARHQRLGRIVALKVIRKDRLKDPEAIKRFRREIQAVAQFSHPNIVLAYDADEVGGTHFFVMEYVEGVSLSDKIKGCGPMPVAQACDYIRQAALGLQHAHERGLVHRDIKPSNLLVTQVPNLKTTGQASSFQLTGAEFGLGSLPYGLVKILDLGLARLRQGSNDDPGELSLTLTRNGVLMGTPDYIATEQAANPHSADIRSDLYSLGCTFYFLLTGSVPFPGGSAVEKLFRHQSDDPTSLEQMCPHVPTQVAAIVRKLMAKKPEDRYQTPKELAEALEKLLPPSPTLHPSHDAETVIGSISDEMAPVSDSQAALLDADDSSPWDRAVNGQGAAAANPSPRVRRQWWFLVGGGLAALLIGLGLFTSLLLGGSLTSTPLETSPITTQAQTTAPQKHYVRKPTRNETVLATLKANGLPNLAGTWFYIGPFDNNHHRGFREVYPPETEIDLTKSYRGRGDKPAVWKAMNRFRLGETVDLNVFQREENEWSVIYLYHAFEAAGPCTLPLAVGADDTLTVWLNGQQLMARENNRGWMAGEQDRVTLHCKAGKNHLLIKVCNFNGGWAVYAMPQFPPSLEAAFDGSLRRDFPNRPK